MKVKAKQIQITNGKLLIGGSSTSTETGYTIPASVGSNGHVLTSDGTNVVFQAASGSGGGGLTFDDATGTTLTPSEDYHYNIDNASGCTVTLPAAGTQNKQISLKNIHATSTVTVNPGTNGKIDGDASGSITLTSMEAVTLIRGSAAGEYWIR